MKVKVLLRSVAAKAARAFATVAAEDVALCTHRREFNRPVSMMGNNRAATSYRLPGESTL